MPQYLISGYLPDDFDPSTQDEAIVEEIHALNREMIAAGVRKFAGGLGPARNTAGAAQWRTAAHRRTVPGDQGTRGRFVDTGMR